MRDPSLSSSSFPTAHCGACDRGVLVYVTLDAEERERRCCVHCDAEVGPELRWVTAGELEAEGYYFGAPPARQAGGGCAGGCGTCGTRTH